MGMMVPPSLTSIRIQNFKNLEYMYSKGFQQLTSLQDCKLMLVLSSHLFRKKICFSRLSVYTFITARC
ncbi:hypothetical protein Gotri_026559 [Gossypium trilobum]|nr:hypothetical protein [Gossypium trilobum]